ncbi:hypothetical protein Tco_1437010 [Tanacetum coccineum]
MGQDVVTIEDDHDVLHDNISSDLALSTKLNDLNYANLNIVGQSMEVEAPPPPPIHVDNNDDFIDDEDDVPYDFSDSNSDNEVRANDVDDDDDEVDDEKMLALKALGTMMDERVLAQVLRGKQRRHLRGIGRKVVGVGTSTVFGSLDQGTTFYSQREMNKGMKKYEDELAAKRSANQTQQENLN